VGADYGLIVLRQVADPYLALALVQDQEAAEQLAQSQEEGQPHQVLYRKRVGERWRRHVIEQDLLGPGGQGGIGHAGDKGTTQQEGRGGGQGAADGGHGSISGVGDEGLRAGSGERRGCGGSNPVAGSKQVIRRATMGAGYIAGDDACTAAAAEAADFRCRGCRWGGIVGRGVHGRRGLGQPGEELFQGQGTAPEGDSVAAAQAGLGAYRDRLPGPLDDGAVGAVQVAQEQHPAPLGQARVAAADGGVRQYHIHVSGAYGPLD
jgi:hypothetical protein